MSKRHPTKTTIESTSFSCVTAITTQALWFDVHLKDIWIIHVHEISGITATDAIVVDLSAWAAGTSLTHLPEVGLQSEGASS